MADATSKEIPEREQKTVRVSVSFPREIYETLELIAHKKKVSVAWVVRDAAEQYVENKWPLFGQK